jgi:hypothetical protein
MRRSPVTLAISFIAALCAVGAYYGSSLAIDDGAGPRRPAEVGRFQAAGGDQNEIWLVDTKTGECWRAHTLGDKRTWEQLVPPLPVHPPKAKPDKI